jgi:molybdopterin-guanine dinucleotide biosynthesis protein A
MVEQRAILAVLAGGRGERIGGAKALVRLGDRPLIERPLAAAREAGLEAIVLAKRDTALPALEERVIHEPDAPRHPLCGVLAALDFAHQRTPPAAVVLVACDMPFITGALLGWLAELDGAAMAHVGGRAEPLLSRVEPSHRAPLRRALAERTSLRAALGELAPRILDAQAMSRFGDPARLCFSVNDAEDLLRAERWLA